MKRVPFSILPPPLLESLSHNFENFGYFSAAFFPFMHDSLLQAESDYTSREYSSLAFTAAFFNGMALLLLFLAIAAATRNLQIIAVGAGLTVVVFFASFITILYYPQVLASKRTRELDTTLIPAVRQLLIEIKSGVPLFNAMASVSTDYGEVSKEFRKIVQKINSGIPELDAIAEATTSNPNPQFRRVLWQISNALKVGSDIATVLELQVAELTRERIDQIRKYGQELSPWTMIYMMTAVIMPSLGLTMMIVVVGLLNVVVPKLILAVVILGLTGFQLFFMNFVGSRRPVI